MRPFPVLGVLAMAAALGACSVWDDMPSHRDAEAIPAGTTTPERLSARASEVDRFTPFARPEPEAPASALPAPPQPPAAGTAPAPAPVQAAPPPAAGQTARPARRARGSSSPPPPPGTQQEKVGPPPGPRAAAPAEAAPAPLPRYASAGPGQNLIVADGTPRVLSYAAPDGPGVIHADGAQGVALGADGSIRAVQLAR